MRRLDPMFADSPQRIPQPHSYSIKFRDIALEWTVLILGWAAFALIGFVIGCYSVAGGVQ